MNAPNKVTLGENGVVVDFATDKLLDSTGETIPLRPQALAILRYLAERPAQLATKDDLMAAVWPGVAVTDDSLVQCIGDIRRAIGDDAHAVLKTVPRRGYKLMLTAATPPRQGPRWSLLAVLLLGLATTTVGAWWFARDTAPAAPPLVAVLPFEALSDDPSAARLAEGLTEDLITDLARFPEFEVLSATSTAGYSGGQGDVDAAHDGLGARFMVSGSIERQDGRMRITAQLTDVPSGRHLWSDRWDQPADDFFAIQSEISETIANRLGGGAGLVQETGRNAARRKPPSSLDAYELYLLGTERLERLTLPDLEAALDLLTRAVEEDPGLARAWIEIFHTRHLLASSGVDPDRNRALAEDAAYRALTLDPGDAEAHAVVASALANRNDFVRAKAEFDVALRLAPNAAEILIFYIGRASTFGEPERGADLVARAIRLDPNYPNWANRPFAIANFMAGRYQQAVDFFERLGTDKHNWKSWSMHAGALAALGRSQEAATLVAEALEAHPELSIELVVNEPGWSDAEHQRLIETMRLAGFPPCDRAGALVEIAAPRRLPECIAGGDESAP
jgi:TolB-like protein